MSEELDNMVRRYVAATEQALILRTELIEMFPAFIHEFNENCELVVSTDSPWVWMLDAGSKFKLRLVDTGRTYFCTKMAQCGTDMIFFDGKQVICVSLAKCVFNDPSEAVAAAKAKIGFLLRELTDILARQDLTKFCHADDVSSVGYSESYVDVESFRWGLRRFMEYVIANGAFPEGADVTEGDVLTLDCFGPHVK